MYTIEIINLKVSCWFGIPSKRSHFVQETSSVTNDNLLIYIIQFLFSFLFLVCTRHFRAYHKYKNTIDTYNAHLSINHFHRNWLWYLFLAILLIKIERKISFSKKKSQNKKFYKRLTHPDSCIYFNEEQSLSKLIKWVDWFPVPIEKIKEEQKENLIIHK